MTLNLEQDFDAFEWGRYESHGDCGEEARSGELGDSKRGGRRGGGRKGADERFAYVIALGRVAVR